MESKRTIRLLALILLIIALGVGLFFLLKDRRQGPGGDPSAHATELTAEPADTSVPTDAASDPAAATDPAASTNPDVTADPDGTEDASVTSSPDVTDPNATPTPAAPTQSPGSAPYVVPTVPAQPSVPADMTQTPAVPTQSNSASTPAPTPSPVPTPTPTAEPTGTPAAANTPTPTPSATPAPDPVTALTWLEPGSSVTCDLDFDFKYETVELNHSVNSAGVNLITLRVKVGKNGKTLEDTFVADSFVSALINNFNSGDNRVEIIVSTLNGVRDEQIRAYRLNERSDGLSICKLSGTVFQIDDNSIRVHRYVDLMGTWDCVAPFSFSYDSFALVQNGTDWDVLRDPGRTCTVAKDLLVGIYSSGNDNLSTFVYEGSLIYPLATDLQSRVDIVLESGAHGFITVTVGPDGRFLYGGVHLDDFFSDLVFR